MADNNSRTKRDRTRSTVEALTHQLSENILADSEPNPSVKDNIIYIKLCRNTVLTRKNIVDIIRTADNELKIYAQDGYMIIKIGEPYPLAEIKRRAENEKKLLDWERYCDVVDVHDNEVELRTFWSNEIQEIKECKKDYTIYSKENTIFVCSTTKNEQEVQRNSNKRGRIGA